MNKYVNAPGDRPVETDVQALARLLLEVHHARGVSFWKEDVDRLQAIIDGAPSEAEQAAAEAAGPEPDFPPPSVAG